MPRIPRPYVLVPAVILCIVLANAFFGHLLFGSAYDRLINKYSIYVHLQQPGWKSNPGNILYDVTNVWSDSADDIQYLNNGAEGASAAGPDGPHALSVYNPNRVMYQEPGSYVELRHGFGGCQHAWQPISYRYAVDSTRSWIESMQGVRVLDAPRADAAYADAARADPYVWISPDVPNSAYDDSMQHALVQDGYAQFVPACVSGGLGTDTTVIYDYTVSINDQKIGFDVYFARPARDNETSIRGFVPYEGPGCGAQNRNSFSGTCKGAEQGSGLLIILPDMLEQSLTQVRIGMHERPHAEY